MGQRYQIEQSAKSQLSLVGARVPESWDGGFVLVFVDTLRIYYIDGDALRDLSEIAGADVPLGPEMIYQ